MALLDKMMTNINSYHLSICSGFAAILNATLSTTYVVALLCNL